MKRLLAIILLAAALAASPAVGQTIKSLGYNITDGRVIYSNTNPITFTNPVNFGFPNGANPAFGVPVEIYGTLNINPADTDGSGGEAQPSLTVGAFTANGFTGTNTVTVNTESGISFGGNAAGLTRTNLGLGASNTATFGNVVLNNDGNLAPAQTADSASSLMTRGLSDVRYSPMPMTPQIVPWFYNGSLGVVRVTNGSATLGTLAAYPSINVSTNAGDSGAIIMTSDVWGATDGARNPWNAVGRSVIIQGRLAAGASNAVARYVWSSSTNWPTLITNVGTNGISNLGWAVETRNTAGISEARLIVNGATNKSESAFTPIGFNAGNDSSFMVISRVGFTSLYWASSGEPFTRTPLITVTNGIGGSASGAFQGGLGFSIVNTNTSSGSSGGFITRCYQVLGMTNYGY